MEKINIIHPNVRSLAIAVKNALETIPVATFKENLRGVYVRDRSDVEFSFYLYNISDQLFNYKSHFLSSVDPFQFLLRYNYREIGKIVPYSFTDHLTFLHFLQTFDFNTLYDGFNKNIKIAVNRLEKMRAKYSQFFLVNPYEGDLKYSHVGSTFSCGGITMLTGHSDGERVIVDKDTLDKRIDEFTFGMLKNSYNKNVKEFCWDNVALSGGSLCNMINTNYNPRVVRSSDFDLFVYGKTFDEKNRTFKRLIEWFTDNTHESSHIYYGLTGSVLSIYIKNINRKFQIISSNAQKSADVIGNFDFTNLKWVYDGNSLFGTPDAINAITSGVAHVAADFGNKPMTQRLIKTLYYGYNVTVSEEFRKESTIDIILKQETNQLKDILTEMKAVYYPRDELYGNDADEETEYIISMIAKDPKLKKVTTDRKYIIDNFVVDGNFSDYTMIDYTSFDKKDLIVTRLYYQEILKTKTKSVRLLSDETTVVKFIRNAEGITITVEVSDDFAKFYESLEDVVFPMYNRLGVTTTTMVNNQCKLEITQFNLLNQVQKGYTCLNDKRGFPLNIEEDLKDGDKIKFLFQIQLLSNHLARKINLRPIKLIKQIAVESDDEINVGADVGGINVGGINDNNAVNPADVEEITCEFEQMKFE